MSVWDVMQPTLNGTAQPSGTAARPSVVCAVGAVRAIAEVGEVGVVAPRPTFEEFVQARSPALLRSAYLLAGDRALAEDLLQTAWSKVWPRWERLVRAGDPEAYVRRVLYTSSVSAWRRRRLAEWPSDDVELAARGRALADDGGLDVDQIRTQLLDALRLLSRGQRAVVVLRYFEDRTEAETAAVLGCSVGTVKSQAARAMARLRQSPLLADEQAPVEEGS